MDKIQTGRNCDYKGCILMDFLLLFIKSLFFNSVTWKSSDVVSSSHWCTLKHTFKKISSLGGLYVRVLFSLLKNVGQDLITVNKCFTVLFTCPAPNLKSIYWTTLSTLLKIQIDRWVCGKMQENLCLINFPLKNIPATSNVQTSRWYKI